jgi:hypothetical protein
VIGKKLITFLCIICSPFSIANIITVDNYSLDKNTNLITDNYGQEWLRWSETSHVKDLYQTYNDYKSNGWELATNLQMSRLFNDFKFGVSFDDDPLTAQSARFNDGAIEDPTSPIKQFFTLFGVNVKSQMESDVLVDIESISAIFGDNYTNRWQYLNLATLKDDHFEKFSDDNGGFIEGYSDGSASLGAPGIDLFGENDRPFAFIRITTSVSEPETFFLLLFAVTAISVHRKRKFCV